MPPPAVARRLLLGIELEKHSVERRSAADAVRARLRTLLQLPEELIGFEPFPARHLRPNSFMITHAVLRRLHLFLVSTKLDTYALESGHRSFTRQLQRIGLTSLVVDRSGAVYAPEQWPFSRTFLQGDQEGLLVADNQTLSYAHGDLARRRLLSAFAWGSLAEPRAPRRSPAEPLGEDR
jgi:hypothetical protein